MIESTPAPGSQVWQRVCTRYVYVDLLLRLIPVPLPLFALLITHNLGVSWIITSALSVITVLLLFAALLSFRRVRAIGYMLRADDLLFRRGIMFERIVSVPYGRLQIVDIYRGPLLRWQKLATLKFVTAAAASGVELPGLTEAAALELRDKLVDLAETRRAGL